MPSYAYRINEIVTELTKEKPETIVLQSWIRDNNGKVTTHRHNEFNRMETHLVFMVETGEIDQEIYYKLRNTLYATFHCIPHICREEKNSQGVICNSTSYALRGSLESWLIRFQKKIDKAIKNNAQAYLPYVQQTYTK